jgi:hypothetical protein
MQKATWTQFTLHTSYPIFDHRWQLQFSSIAANETRKWPLSSPFSYYGVIGFCDNHLFPSVPIIISLLLKAKETKKCLLKLQNVAFSYVTLRYTTLHYVTLRYTTLHYVTLRYTTLHYVTLHYTTLHYITPFLIMEWSGLWQPFVSFGSHHHFLAILV